MLNVSHSNLGQLAKEVLVLFAAWRLSQAHSSLIKRKSVSCSHVWVCQAFPDAPNCLAINKSQVKIPRVLKATAVHLVCQETLRLIILLSQMSKQHLEKPRLFP